MASERRKRDPSHDLLRNTKFVKLTVLYDLALAEGLRKALRDQGVAAVIINDERVQARSPEERARAEAPREGFRLEVPEAVVEKAREILHHIEIDEEE